MQTRRGAARARAIGDLGDVNGRTPRRKRRDVRRGNRPRVRLRSRGSQFPAIFKRAAYNYGSTLNQSSRKCGRDESPEHGSIDGRAGTRA